MALTTRPLFALYVMWHPAYTRGRELADRLRQHFGPGRHRFIAGERGVSVLERSEAAPETRTPSPIDWDGAEFTAVVALTDATLVADREWAGYVRDVAHTAHARGLPAAFFPVAMDGRALDLAVQQQALRWDRWEVPDDERTLRLMTNLTHEFCRVLRSRLDQLGRGAGDSVGLERYLEKVRVFISHSKHDGDGETVGRSIRDWIHAHGPLDSFFDVRDIPPGLSFEDVLLHQIGTCAVMAVHTDSYSSREWCRREVIEAKRRLAPMIVVDCVRDIDPRGMAYLGNVPVVRMEPGSIERIGAVVGCLMDEVFRTWLWLCRVGRDLADAPGVLFTARPPELITLAAMPLGDEGSTPVIVYPEPLLSADEERLFSEIAPRVRVRTLTEWLEER